MSLGPPSPQTQSLVIKPADAAEICRLHHSLARGGGLEEDVQVEVPGLEHLTLGGLKGKAEQLGGWLQCQLRRMADRGWQNKSLFEKALVRKGGERRLQDFWTYFSFSGQGFS